MNRRDFLRASALLPFGSLWAVAPGSGPDVTYLTPRDGAFEAFRRTFNRRIDAVPAAIAVCSTEKGVQDAVGYARERALPVAVRSGGHDFEGFCVNDGGLVVDLSRMDACALDGNRFTAGPGCTIEQAYDALLPNGRLIPLGSCGGVGLAGLTLGGGYGMFSRRYGLACDALTGVRMVGGSGGLYDSDDDPELAWACRGGGNGNFGVVTELRFATAAAPAEMHSARTKFRGLTPAEAVEHSRRWFETALPDDAFSAFVLNGRTLTILVTSTGERIEPFGPGESRTRPIADAVRPFYGRSEPTYFKNASAGFYRGFEDFGRVFEAVGEERGVIFQINTLGGTIARPELARRSAYPHREFGFLGEVQCYWERASETPAGLRAVERIQSILGDRPHYRNYPDRAYSLESYYGVENLARLRRVKARVDPENRIRHPQSV